MAAIAVFHSAASRPSPRRHPSNPNPTTGLLRLPASHHPSRRRRLLCGAASPPAERDQAGSPAAASALERCLAASASPAAAPPRAPPAMKGGKQYGAFGAVTLEKAKLDLSQRLKKVNPELATGGGGGDIGKRIGHGGGDGGDDDGDDDDYFDDFDDEDEGEGGLFRRRIVIKELFNREFVDAVLQEWYKTMSNLPAGLRQAYEMGLVSSAQMVRYLSIFGRPTKSRHLSRALPAWFSRGLVGRMLADPSFLHKMTFEFVATLGLSVWWEVQNRKERFKQEWDLVLVNALTASFCNATVVLLLAPCRSYGSTSKLPNNIFEKSYPMREFDLQKRIYSFFYQAARLCPVGLFAGAIQGGLSKALSTRKERRLSMTIPSVSTNALGYGAFLGLYANLRYQILCGLDQYMVNRFDVLSVAISFSTILRLLNIQIGESSRHAWLGEEADPLYSDRLLRAYNRPVEVAVDQQESRWFISKDAIVSGLGLLGIKQGGPEVTASKPRRKRVVRKKVSSS